MEVQVSVDGGVTWYPYFYGYAMPKEISIFSFSRKVTGTDILYLLDQNASDDIVWNGETYLNAIEDILLDAGIPSSLINLPTSLDDITERNSITHTVTTSDNLKDILTELLKFGRYVVYVDASGSVRMRKYSTVPEASATIKFSTDDVQDDEYGIATNQFGRQVGTNDQVVKKVVVKYSGSDIEAEGSWETTSDKAENGKTVTVSNKFAKTSEQCEELATDYGQDECRNNYTTTFDVGSDVDLRPGVCIELKSAANGFTTFTPARIIKTSIKNNGLMNLVVSTNPRAIGSGDSGGEGLTEDGYDDTSNPIADFTYTVEKEGELYGIILQSTSTSDASEISSYSWSISGAGVGYPSPVLGNTANEMTVVDTLSIDITLEVTDNNSNTGSVTKTVSDTEIDLYTRQLQAIADDRWYVLLDYDTGWFDITPSGKTASVVPRYSDTQYLFAAMSDGTVWRYDVENSSTDAVQIASLSGVPSDIAQGEAFVSEESANCLIVAHGTALSVSYNALETNPTFQTYTFAATVNAVGVNPYNTNVLYACAGNSLFITYSKGVSWEQELSGEAGSTAIDFCSFPWAPGIAVLFNDYTDLSNAVLPNQDIDWNTVTPDGTLQSITPGLEDEVLRISSSAGETFLISEDGTVSETHDGTTLNDTKRIVRDGYFNDIVWLADSSSFSVGKQVKDNALFSLLSGTSAASSVGYGQLLSVKETPSKPVRAFVIWFPPWAKESSGDIRPVWIYRNGEWTSNSNAPPNTGATYNFYWHTISVDTADPQKILAVGCSNQDSSFEFVFSSDGDYLRAVSGIASSPFRVSDDGGDSWYDLRVNQPSGLGWNKIRLGKQGDRAFLVDGKLYTILAYDATPRIYYILYGGEITWNASGYYEVDSSYWYGTFNLSGDNFNLIAAFAYHEKDVNGYPIIPWVSRYNGRVGYITYAPTTDTVNPNLRTESNIENNYYKKITTIISTNEMVYSGVNYTSKYFADYTSGNPTTVDIANENSFNYVAKHASDKNDVLYSVEDRLSKPNSLVSPYDTTENVSELDNDDWFTVARNEQDTSRGRFVAVGSDEVVALYDADKDTWQVIDYAAGMSGMSSIAFAVGAE
jgi:hypothetical protein